MRRRMSFGGVVVIVALLLQTVLCVDPYFDNNRVSLIDLDVGMEASSTELVIQQTRKGLTYVGWTAWNEDDPTKRHVHLTPVDGITFKRKGDDIVIQDAGDLDYFLLHDDGSFVLLVHDEWPLEVERLERPRLFLQKHDASGKRLWKEVVLPTRDGGLGGMGYYASSMATVEHMKGDPRLNEGRDMYVMYIRRRGAQHHMDSKVMFDAADGHRVKTLPQQCSHSLTSDMSFHSNTSRGFLSYCLKDGEESGAVVYWWLPLGVKRQKSTVAIPAPANSGGYSAASTSNLIQLGNGRWVMMAGLCRSDSKDKAMCPENDLTGLVLKVNEEEELSVERHWLEKDASRSNFRSPGLFRNMAIHMQRYDDRNVLAVWTTMNPDKSDRRTFLAVLDHNMQWVVAPEDVTGKVVAPADEGGNGKVPQRMRDGGVVWGYKTKEGPNIIKIARVGPPPSFSCPDNINDCFDKSLCQYRYGKKECHCPPGFITTGAENGVTCEDVRCATHADNCGTEALCKDVGEDIIHAEASGFRCSCRVDWLGDEKDVCYRIPPSKRSRPLHYGTPITEYLHYGDVDTQIKPTDAVVAQLPRGLGGVMAAEGVDTVGSGVAWERMGGMDNVCDLELKYFYKGAFYTTVYSPKTQVVKLQMRFKLEDLKVYLDGEQVYNIADEFVQKWIAEDDVTVELSKGWHDIVVYMEKNNKCFLSLAFLPDIKNVPSQPFLAVAPQRPSMNECDPNAPEHACSSNEYCKDLKVGYTCQCPAGQSGDPWTTTCASIQGSPIGGHLTADGKLKDALWYHGAVYEDGETKGCTKSGIAVEYCASGKYLYPEDGHPGGSGNVKWAPRTTLDGNLAALGGWMRGSLDAFSFGLYASEDTRVPVSVALTGKATAKMEVYVGSSRVINKDSQGKVDKSLDLKAGWNRIFCNYRTKSRSGKFEFQFREPSKLKLGWALSVPSGSSSVKKGGAGTDVGEKSSAAGGEGVSGGLPAGSAAAIVLGVVCGLLLVAVVLLVVRQRRGLTVRKQPQQEMLGQDHDEELL